jgi:hypothetical protein
MPPPVGVVSGPLMPTRYFLKVVEGGLGEPVAGGVVGLLARGDLVPVDLALAVVGLLDGGVEDELGGGQMSGPVPSPSMKGMMGVDPYRSIQWHGIWYSSCFPKGRR